MLYPKGIDHNVLFIEGRDSARKVVENESMRFDLQTGKSLVEDRYESIVRSIMSDASAGCANDIVQHVMDFIVKVGGHGLGVRKVWRPVSLVFFQVVVCCRSSRLKYQWMTFVDIYLFAKTAQYAS